LLLETSPHELTAHQHELGDAELSSNLQSADVCQELAVGEQLVFASDEAHIDNDELTDESAVIDNLGQFLHDTAVPNNVTKRVDSVTSDLCDTDICHTPLACSNNNVFKDQLGVNNLEQFDGRQSFETSQDKASYDSSCTQEVTVAVKQCDNVTDSVTLLNICQKLITEDTDCSVVQTGLSEIHSIDHDRGGPDSAYFSRSNRESAILHDVSGDESCKDKDACDSVMHDRCSAEVEKTASEVAEVDLMWHTLNVSPNGKVEEVSNYVIKDTEVDYTLSPLDCENTKFMDIPVESRAQRVKLALDSSEIETICCEERKLLSLFGCISDKIENVSRGFPIAVEFQQNSDCLKAGIYAYFDGMELCDDMELIPVEDGKDGTVHNREDTETICKMNNYVNHTTNFTSLSNNSNLLNADIFAFFGGVELHDIELIPVDDEKTGTVHNWKGPETVCDINNYSNTAKTIKSYSSDVNSQACDDENERLELTNSLEMHKMASMSHNDEQLETVPRDNGGLEIEQQITDDHDALDVVDNYLGELAQPSDSGIRFPLTPEHASISDQMSQYASTTHDIDQEKSQLDVVLTHSEEACDSSNERSEPTGVADEKGRTSDVSISGDGSVKSVTEMQTVDMVVSLESTAGNALTEIVDPSMSFSGNASETECRYLCSTKNSEVMKNGERENNTGCASIAYTVCSACADLEIVAGFSENNSVSTVHNAEGPKTITGYSHDISSQAYGDKNEQLELTDSLETHKMASTSYNNEQLETMPRGSSGLEFERKIIGDCDALDMVDNYGELAQPSDSGSRLLLTPEHASISDQMSQYASTTHDIDQEKSQHDLVLKCTEDVCDGSNENSEPTGVADEKGRTSDVPISGDFSVKSVAEMQTVDMDVSLETTAGTALTEIMDSSVSGNALEMVGSYLSSTKNLEVMKNGEHENVTGCASSAYTAHSACADLDFHIGAGFSENNIVEHYPDLLLVNNEKISTIFRAHEDIPFSVYEHSAKELELFTADDVSLQTRRLELDDLTVTVTCFIPEEDELLPLDDDMLDNDNESAHLEMDSTSSSSKLTANDPILSNGPDTFMDNNLISADKMFPRHRSSELMLPYLMPIDETAEFIDDNDRVCDKSQPTNSLNDMKTEPNNSDEQKMAYDINASPTVERDIAEPGSVSSTSNVYDLENAAFLDNECKTKSSDDTEQIICEESHSFLKTAAERKGQEVGTVNKNFDEDSVAVAARNFTASADVTQVSYLLGDNFSGHVTTSEHTTLTVNLLSHACSKDNALNRDDAFTLFAADAMQQSSIYSGEKTAQSSISDLGDEHFLDMNAVNQNKLEGNSDMTEKMENSENNKTVGLHLDTLPSDETVFGENSAVTHTAELKFNNEPCRHSAETAMQVCERPVLQSNKIHSIIDAINNSLVHAHQTLGDKQQTTDEEHSLSQMDSNDRDASHSFASAASNSSPVVVEARVEMEEPAVDALTDFESTLEQLHSTRILHKETSLK